MHAWRAALPTRRTSRRPRWEESIIEAGTQDRAAFAEQPNELWIVDAFEIATKWPPIP